MKPMKLVAKKLQDANEDPAVRQARIDLAAAYRLAVIQGFSEGIFNHFTLAVPGTDDRFLTIPVGWHWSEATASDLLEVSYDGHTLSGNGEVERTAFCIHAPIHQARPSAACVLHTHMPYCSALTRLEEPEIQAIGQTEVGFLDQIAYDEHYDGLAYDPAEGARLAEVLGPEKTILFMANHGVVVVGKTVAEAYDRLYYLERACQVQVLAMSTQRKLKQLPQAVVDKTRAQFRQGAQYLGKRGCELHFDALKRMLDRQDPGYAQ
jgi:ribulose-5-phosphate 4-epimerase/fuculose-1-phosphate aldolase